MTHAFESARSPSAGRHRARGSRGLAAGGCGARAFDPETRADAGAMRRIDEILLALRDQGRRAVHIVALGCGDGLCLTRVAMRASALGFVAIDAHGCDCDRDQIARARAAAATIHDPRIGLAFDIVADTDALADEEASGADILIYPEPTDAVGMDAPPGQCPAAERDRVSAGLPVGLGHRS